MGNLTMTTGDYVVIVIMSGVLLGVMISMLRWRAQDGRRMPIPSKHAVMRQPDPHPANTAMLPVYEHVCGDLLAMGDASGDLDLGAACERLASDIEARAMVGAQKYGTHLHANNGRTMAIDAYQEALDLIQYAKGMEIEAGEQQDYMTEACAICLQEQATKILLTLDALRNGLPVPMRANVH